MQHAIAEAIEVGGPFHWFERIVRPEDGAIRELETIGDAVHNEGGHVTSLVGTCRDVTDERERGRQLRLFADIFHNVQIGLSVWSVGRGEKPEDLTLTAYNAASERIAGMSLAASIGKSLAAILPYAAGGSVEGLLMRAARERRVQQEHIERLSNPTQPRRALSAKSFPLPGRSVGLAVEDVTGAAVERRLQSAEHCVLEMIARGAALEESLKALILAVEDYSPSVTASVQLLSPDGLTLHHVAAPHLPESYVAALDDAPIGPNAGSCGTAAYRKEMVVAADIAHDPRWEKWRALALEHGLRACWSTPILTPERAVLGTFAFYYRDPRHPTPADLEIAARAARLAGVAIERKCLETQLRDLSAHLESAREEERRGIAREIHDELGQALTAIKMDIAWILRRASAETPLPRESLLEKLAAMSDVTDQVIQQVRRISSELRPGVLDDLGLIAAIEWLAQEFEEKTGTLCVVRSNATDAPVGHALATAVFRIFQEALTNVARHARAQHVEVKVELSAESLVLEVRDDGVGISPEAAQSPTSLGLLGVRERAHRLGGSVTVRPGTPKGTTLSLRVPVVGARREAPAEDGGLVP